MGKCEGYRWQTRVVWARSKPTARYALFLSPDPLRVAVLRCVTLEEVLEVSERNVQLHPSESVPFSGVNPKLLIKYLYFFFIQ